MAVDDRKVGVFMFLPAVAYIALLIGVPLILAVLYAFSDARIGTVGFHFVGLENFRRIFRLFSTHKGNIAEFYIEVR